MRRPHGTPELTETHLWIGRGRNDAGGERDGGTAAADVCTARPGCAAQRHRETRGGIAERCRSSQARTSPLGPSLAPASLGMAPPPLASPSLVSRLMFAQGGHRELVPTLRKRPKLLLQGTSHFFRKASSSSSYFAGASRNTRCPVLGITSTLAFGILAASALANSAFWPIFGRSASGALGLPGAL